MNCKKKGIVSLNNEEMEQVKEHVYLGTIISANGERYSEMKSRIQKPLLQAGRERLWTDRQGPRGDRSKQDGIKRGFCDVMLSNVYYVIMLYRYVW